MMKNFECIMKYNNVEKSLLFMDVYKIEEYVSVKTASNKKTHSQTDLWAGIGNC